MRGGVHHTAKPPGLPHGKVSQIVIDNLSMTEGDAKKQISNHFQLLFHLISFSIMANRNEKAFQIFVPFESDDAKQILEEKKALEFPQLTTATGKCKLQRLIKWESITYRGRDMDIPVVAVKVGNTQKQVTLSTLFGKERTFIVDREAANYPKGSKWKINNLVEWTPELQSKTSARNAAVMAAVTDNKEITLQTLWGHFDNENNKGSFNLTFIVEGATKL